jgi:hypothetical protein
MRTCENEVYTTGTTYYNSTLLNPNPQRTRRTNTAYLCENRLCIIPPTLKSTLRFSLLYFANPHAISVNTGYWRTDPIPGESNTNSYSCSLTDHIQQFITISRQVQYRDEWYSGRGETKLSLVGRDGWGTRNQTTGHDTMTDGRDELV